jgi:hypothetical protein
VVLRLEGELGAGHHGYAGWKGSLTRLRKSAGSPGRWRWIQASLSLAGATRGCLVMLVLIGPYWLGAPGENKGARRLDDPEDWVRREIAAGLSRPTLVVVPVLLDGAAIPAVDELPTALAGIHHRNAVALSGDRLDEEVDQLVNSIENGHIARLLVEAGRPAFLTINEPAPQRVRVNSALVLGSATDADVVVTGEGVAERHARIWPVPEGLIVEDLGSSGGTLIDGRRINAASTITRPAELTLGRTTVTISVADETDENREIRLWPSSSADTDDLPARDADA